MSLAQAQIEAAGAAFRSRMGLLSVEDMQCWLATAQLDVERWWCWVEDELRRATAGEPASELADEMLAAARAATREGGTPVAPAVDPALGAGARTTSGFGHVASRAPRDCGIAALTAVCRHHGMEVGMAAVRAHARPAGAGVTLGELASAARRLGLHARMVKSSAQGLDKLALPAIMHVDGRHWVVLYALDERWAYISDPARGRLRMARARLAGRWSGYALLSAPMPVSANSETAAP